MFKEYKSSDLHTLLEEIDQETCRQKQAMKEPDPVNQAKSE